MITVALNDLRFEAFHGIYEEEKILGNTYLVDCVVELHEANEVIWHINDTVDYSKVYDIIRERMKVPTPLLETLCMETGIDIHNSYPDAKSIFIKIKKMHPSIEGFVGNSSVSWHKVY